VGFPPRQPWFLGLVKNVRPKLADLQPRRRWTSTAEFHRLPVDVGAVEATDVDDRGIRRSPTGAPAVPAAHGDVVEEDVAAGMSALPTSTGLIQQETGNPVLGPRFTTIKAPNPGAALRTGDRAGRRPRR